MYMRVVYGVACGNNVSNNICRDTRNAGNEVRNGPEKDLGTSANWSSRITIGIIFSRAIAKSWISGCSTA